MSGNIGVGKSTVCDKLASNLANGFFIGEELENPYLEKFYDCMARKPDAPNPYALKLQEYFLDKRYENEAPYDEREGVLITDRFLLEYYEIFVKNLMKSGLMSPEDFHYYCEKYEQLRDRLKKPDVIVFLKSNVETNIARINKRNRDAESGKIDENYLRSLHTIYENFLSLLKQDHGYIRLIEVETDDKSAEEVYKIVENRLIEEYSDFIN